MNAIYDLSGITKRYSNGKISFDALRGIDLKINKGDVVALTGPSGSGKSTLLNILGLIEQPTAGEMSFAGHELKNKPEKTLTNVRRLAVGFIFQNFNLVPVLSAVENVEYALLLDGRLSREESRKQATHCLDVLGIADYADHKPSELSGGQRQRVAIARAIVKKPKVVIADEPTANLDSKTADQIMTIIHDLNSAWKTTVVVATHDPALAGSAGRVVKIKDGLVQTIK